MTERVDLLKRLQAAAEQVLGDEAPTLTEEMSLGHDTIDSLDLVEIMMIIEDEEGFVIDGESLADVVTIGGVLDAIMAMRAAHA